MAQNVSPLGLEAKSTLSLCEMRVSQKGYRTEEMQSNRCENDKPILDMALLIHQTAHYESFPAILPNQIRCSRRPSFSERLKRLSAPPEHSP